MPLRAFRTNASTAAALGSGARWTASNCATLSAHRAGGVACSSVHEMPADPSASARSVDHSAQVRVPVTSSCHDQPFSTVVKSARACPQRSAGDSRESVAPLPRSAPAACRRAIFVSFPRRQAGSFINERVQSVRRAFDLQLGRSQKAAVRKDRRVTAAGSPHLLPATAD